MPLRSTHSPAARTLRSASGAGFVAMVTLVAFGTVPFLPQATASAPPVGPSSDPSTDVERVVAGDMVVDWIGGAPKGAAAALAAGGVPTELTIARAAGPDPADDTASEARADAVQGGHDVTEPHAAASGGYALFSATARWLPTGYTIRLVGGDRRIEQYRDELEAAARAAATTTGRSIRLAAGSEGSAEPARGEIVVELASSPCGPHAAGCGGPRLTLQEIVGGRVWISPSSLGLAPAQRINLAAHELGHALGLQHFDGSWTDGRQVMYPVVSTVTPFRAGDSAGLRHLADTDARPGGTVEPPTYAAGLATISGTLSSGSRVRISSGRADQVVTAKGGRFSGSLPLPAGRHLICATSLDAAPGFRRDLGCRSIDAAGVPVGRFDGATDSFSTIRISGWAIDAQTKDPVAVEVRRNGSLLATIRADQARTDLGELASGYGTLHGFAADVPAGPGRNNLCLRILGVGAGGNRDIGCVQVAHRVDPIGALDGASTDGLGARLTGWALDPNTPEPVTVQVFVDGKAAAVGGSVAASAPRRDVADTHPAHGSNHGLDHRVPLAPGRHELCVTATNVGLGSDRSLGCVQVVVENALTAPVAAVIAEADDALGAVVGAAGTSVRTVQDLLGTLGR